MKAFFLTAGIICGIIAIFIFANSDAIFLTPLKQGLPNKQSIAANNKNAVVIGSISALCFAISFGLSPSPKTEPKDQT